MPDRNVKPLGVPAGWKYSRSEKFDTSGLYGTLGGSSVALEYHGYTDYKKFTDSHRYPNYETPSTGPSSNKLELVEAYTPSFLSVLRDIDAFAPKGLRPLELRVIAHLVSTKNDNTSNTYVPKTPLPGDPEDLIRSTINLTVSRVKIPWDGGHYPKQRVPLPPEIIEYIFAHELGHTFFDQYLISTGYDFRSVLQALNDKNDKLFMQAVVNAEQKSTGTSGFDGLREMAGLINDEMSQPWTGNRIAIAKKRIKNLIMPYSELVADVYAVLYSNDLNAIRKVVEFSVNTDRFLYKDNESYDLSAASVRSFVESENKGPVKTVDGDINYHAALELAREFIGEKLLGKPLTVERKRQIISRLMEAVKASIKENEALVRSTLFPFSR